jgi:hypothetical protein
LNDLQKLEQTSDTIKIITQTYGDMAGDEILLRALYSHRNLDYASSRFWIDVYSQIFRNKPEKN